MFDVVGIRKHPDYHYLLILGLEATLERNLDEFKWIDDYFQNYGFEKHVNPRLEALQSFIHGKGHYAESVGKFGYPTGSQLNLKEEAIRMGLGKRGKSTVVLHDKFGARLRFAAIQTNAPLESLIRSSFEEKESPFCSGCTICIDNCPVSVLKPYQMPDTSDCLSNIVIMPEDKGRLMPCDICLLRCPANRNT